MIESDAADPHAGAALAATLLCAAPYALGGVALAGLGGPGRDWLVARLTKELGGTGDNIVRLPPGTDIDAMLGGLDLVATLATGSPVAQPGLLARANDGVVVIPMAERLADDIVATLNAAIDCGEVTVQRDGIAEQYPSRFSIVAFDESLGDDESLTPSLVDRLALRIDAAALYPDRLARHWPSAKSLAAARTWQQTVTLTEEDRRTLCGLALAFGIGSTRALLQASAAARVHAAMAGRPHTDDFDVRIAAQAVFAHRIRQLPSDGQEQSAPPPEHQTDTEQTDNPSEQRQEELALDDEILAAVAAAVPEALLARLERSVNARNHGPHGRGNDSGQAGERGRPAGIRAYRRGRDHRLNVLATLRAAAPWQRLRGATDRLAIRSDDLRATRRLAPTRATTLFVVDASGSTAAARLAEVKGAIELLLAECYVRRDEVALIAFRGTEPECILSPTRSLARAKRELMALPGGGGTPLAGAVDMAAQLTGSLIRDGRRVLVVFLTDGRGNIGRDGTPGHGEAGAHGLAAAKDFAALGCAALVIDTGRRPRPACREFADAAGAEYLPLPYVDAGGVAGAVRRMDRARAA
ncbi:MAG: magnesium chelatase subunit D [Pseudomonadota bacterium]